VSVIWYVMSSLTLYNSIVYNTLSAEVVQQCGKEEEAYGLCHRHYKEYLSAMINLNKLEVMPLMSVSIFK